MAGLLPPSVSIMRKGDFRMPHQTASIEGICGGGVSCRPGEISLAHNGVLFLDEAAEFRTSVLQMLRVPLETGTVTLSRAGRSTVYPANFQLLMAANPCPCGNYGVEGKICLCSARSVEMYWRKFSGPLLDRVDLRVCVSAVEKEKERNNGGEENKDFSTGTLRKKIAVAVKKQRERGVKNSRLSPQQISEFCVSGPLMAPPAYEMVVVRVKNASDAEAVAKEMLENSDPGKWICVSAEAVRIGVCGDTIMMVMSSAEEAGALISAFGEVCGGLTLTLEK